MADDQLGSVVQVRELDISPSNVLYTILLLVGLNVLCSITCGCKVAQLQPLSEGGGKGCEAV